MNELDGIKDFIEANKESLEKMNQEMIASRGHVHVPLVWLTLDEAKDFKDYFEFICNRTHIGDSMWGEVHYLRNKIVDALMRIEQAEEGHEVE